MLEIENLIDEPWSLALFTLFSLQFIYIMIYPYNINKLEKIPSRKS